MSEMQPYGLFLCDLCVAAVKGVVWPLHKGSLTERCLLVGRFRDCVYAERESELEAAGGYLSV
jgi:hypothetical protein